MTDLFAGLLSRIFSARRADLPPRRRSAVAPLRLDARLLADAGLSPGPVLALAPARARSRTQS